MPEKAIFVSRYLYSFDYHGENVVYRVSGLEGVTWDCHVRATRVRILMINNFYNGFKFVLSMIPSISKLEYQEFIKTL